MQEKASEAGIRKTAADPGALEGAPGGLFRIFYDAGTLEVSFFKEEKMKKRNLGILAALLALCMVLVMLPAGVYADEGWDGSVDTSWYDTEATAFTITTPAQLAGLATIVNGTAEGIETDTFAGKTITLGADLDLNNQNWTPIGRRGTTNTAYEYFSGTFDGAGYTVKNLYIIYDMKGQDSSLIGSVGLFGALSGTAESRIEIKNLTLKGTVTLTYESGTTTPSNSVGYSALAGRALYTNFTGCIVDVNITNNSTATVITQGLGGIVGYGEFLSIERCANLGDIDGGNARYVGGIIGQCTQTQENVFVIKDCYNRGNISAPSKGYAGGLGGFITLQSQTVDIYNFYNTGTVTGSGAYVGSVFGGLNAPKSTLNAGDLYYLEGSHEKAIGKGTAIEHIEVKTDEEMRAPEFVEALNSNNAWKAGLTYPILVCQPDEVTQVADGDIDNSGIVDENDLTLLIGHVLGMDPLSDPDQKTAADINGNGFIDENDVTYLIQIVLHL